MRSPIEWRGRLFLSVMLILLIAGVLLSQNQLTFAEQTPGTPVENPLDPIIDNGSFVQMGINPEGHLNVGGGTPSFQAGTTVVGLRYIPTNGEGTAPGCLCEGWGVANADSATGTFAGYANIAADGGVVGLAVQAGTGVTVPTGHVKPESVGSAFKSIVQTTNGRLRVTHDYHPSASPHLYQVDVTIENIGTTPIGDLRYRRVMDWDIAPFTFSEWVEIHVGTAANLLRATTDGFQSANPLASPGPSVGSPPTTLTPGSPDYFGGPSDQGALFDFRFGTLSVGGSITFRIYYGAGAHRIEALNALATVGAEVYSFGIPRDASGGASTTGPHAFIFGFGGVGGTPVVPFCGDDALDPGEQCDDGNTVDGDGCSATCQIEDDTPPACFISGMNSGPPASISVTAQDAESGLAQINVLKSVNANTVVPAFTAGTNDPVVVTATKINQSKSATIMLQVIDQQGNITTCDPVLTLVIRENGQPVSETFSEIPAWESNVTVSNGDPGLKNLDITVNGTKFKVAGLGDNEERTIDVSSAMVEGNNTIVLTAHGKPGSSANVTIWGNE